MKKSIPIYEISLPEYTINQKPKYDQIGVKLDLFIKQHFLGKKVCIRAVGSQDHKLAKTDLIKRIIEQGTDKYEKDKHSFWNEWDVYRDKGIDLFACFKKITKDFHFMHEVIGDFYEGALADRGYSIRIDILLFYDPDKLENIPIKYAENDIGEDAWKFKFPEQKKEALIGIIQIN